MKRAEDTTLGADAQRELDAVDAALAGEDVAPEHARLGELAVVLARMSPHADAEFIHALDARAERGFRRARARGELSPRRGVAARRVLPGRGAFALSLPRLPLSRPASGLALAAIIAVAVAVPLALTGGHRRAAQPIRDRLGPVPVESAPARAPQTGPLQAAPAAPAPAERSETTGSASSPIAPPAPTRLIERTATLDVGVAPRSIESSAQRVFTLVSAYGGYVRESSVSGGEPGGGGEGGHGEEGERGGASFDIRVPSANLSGAIAALAHLGHVRSENNTTNDVTDQHASLRSALGEAQAERASVLARLRTATAEGEIASLKARLRALDARITRLGGALRALDQRVTYTNLALSLTAESSPAAGAGDLTPGSAAHDAAAILEAALAVLVIAGAALLPLTAVAIAAWAAVALTRRRLREQALDAG